MRIILSVLLVGGCFLALSSLVPARAMEQGLSVSVALDSAGEDEEEAVESIHTAPLFWSGDRGRRGQQRDSDVGETAPDPETVFRMLGAGADPSWAVDLALDHLATAVVPVPGMLELLFDALERGGGPPPDEIAARLDEALPYLPGVGEAARAVSMARTSPLAARRAAAAAAKSLRSSPLSSHRCPFDLPARQRVATILGRGGRAEEGKDVCAVRGGHEMGGSTRGSPVDPKRAPLLLVMAADESGFGLTGGGESPQAASIQPGEEDVQGLSGRSYMLGQGSGGGVREQLASRVDGLNGRKVRGISLVSFSSLETVASPSPNLLPRGLWLLSPQYLAIIVVSHNHSGPILAGRLGVAPPGKKGSVKDRPVMFRVGTGTGKGKRVSGDIGGEALEMVSVSLSDYPDEVYWLSLLKLLIRDGIPQDVALIRIPSSVVGRVQEETLWSILNHLFFS